MLSAFTARPIVELKQRDKSKIESVLAYGDRLLVGLNTGSLRIYRVNEVSNDHDSAATERQSPAPPPAKAFELLREEERFSKNRIEQLAIIKEARILVSLSNGFVSIHDLQTYELQEILTRTKGATVFAATSNIVKDESGVPSIVSRLAVAVKRRLLLWSWHDSELSSDTLELTLVTGIKTLTWATGTKLVAGLSSSYVLVDVESSTVTDIVGPGSIGGAPGQDGGRFGSVGVASMGYIGMGGMVPKPLATKLGEGELLLAKDINTLFVDAEGKPLSRRQIPWSVAPEAIGYSYPFLLALQATKGTLEIRNPKTLNSLQSISLPNASQLYVSQPNISLAHAGKGFLVSSERCIWRMDALGYDDQIDALVERKKLDEALSLLEMLEDALLKDKEGRDCEIKMLKAHDLFEQKKYRESLELFRKVRAPPERVIQLYPQEISGDSGISTGAYEHASDTGEQSQLTDRNHATSDAGKTGEPIQTGSAEASLFTNGNASQKPQQPRGSGDEHGKAKSPQPTSSSPVKPAIDDKDLKTATLELAGFLVDARTELQRNLNADANSDGTHINLDSGAAGKTANLDGLLLPQQPGHEKSHEQRLHESAKLVDTTLFRAYMLAQPSLAGALFRLPNFCDTNVVKEKLLESRRYNDLIDFLFGKRLHSEALDILRKLGQSSDGDDTAAPLRGPQRTVGYLQSLPPEEIDVVLRYAEWPVRETPDLGMEIFLADTQNAETLPRARVLDFLEKIDQNLAVKYLVHIIDELDDSTPEFHQRLLEIYLNGLKSNKFLTDQEKMVWKENFLEFLRNSQHYEAWTLLRRMSSDDPDFYEARAIVLGKMKEHRRALDIYVNKLNNPEKAEEYCNQMYLKDMSSPAASPVRARRLSTTDQEDGPPSVYQTLLSLYLSPLPPRQPQWEPALELLAKHGSRLPASSTLALIPEVLAVKKLESYFRARIRVANTVVNEGRIVAGLRKTLNTAEELKLHLGEGMPGGNTGRNRSVVITEERLCGVCHKRFGGSAIKVLPSNAVVHYGCTAR